MVGINLITPLKNSYTINKKNFMVTQNRMLHNKYYHSKIVFDTDDLIVGTTTYSTYPVKLFFDEEEFVYLEGYIYNLTEYEIKKWIESYLFNNNDNSILINHIEELVESIDGELLEMPGVSKIHFKVPFGYIAVRLPSELLM